MIQTRGSSKEVITALEISKRVNLLDEQNYETLLKKAKDISAMLTVLIQRINNSISN